MLVLISFFYSAGENFPEEGSLSFSLVWGKERAKIANISSTSKMNIYGEAAFQVLKQDERLLKEKQLYLKCIHISSSGVKTNLGSAEILLDANIKLEKKV